MDDDKKNIPNTGKVHKPPKQGKVELVKVRLQSRISPPQPRRKSPWRRVCQGDNIPYRGKIRRGKDSFWHCFGCNAVTETAPKEKMISTKVNQS